MWADKRIRTLKTLIAKISLRKDNRNIGKITPSTENIVHDMKNFYIEPNTTYRFFDAPRTQFGLDTARKTSHCYRSPSSNEAGYSR